MTEHIALPLEIGKAKPNDIIDKDGISVCTIHIGGWRDAKTSNAYAEFIVRACNCHYDLLEALTLAYANLGGTAISEHTFVEVRARMREAITKVTK